MGQIVIDFRGSFDKKIQQTFSAMEHGHAFAVMQAIQYLQEVQLPSAIAQDTRLKAQGHAPSKGFNVDLNKREWHCPNCDQLSLSVVGGEHPCPICGIPTVHDEVPRLEKK